MSTPTLDLEPGALSPQERVRLTVVAGPHSGMTWTFESPVTLTIGREPPSHLVLEQEPALSRRHWRLQANGTLVHLRDDGSRNGTLVNGLRVVEASLQHGDRFGIGDTELTLEILSPEVSDLPPAVGNRQPTQLSPDERKETTDFKPRQSPSIEQTNARRHSETKPQGEASDKDVCSGDAKRSRCSVLPTDHHQLLETAALGTTPQLSAGMPANAANGGASGQHRTGEVIGSYTLNQLLGSGGMADVYKATHRANGQTVAIKLIRGGGQTTEKQRQLFAREAGTILQLKHPRIVRALEFGVQGDQPFLVLEYLATIDLLRLLDQQPREQRIRTSLWVIRRVLTTVGYLHQQDFVHRDIKPSNLLAYRELHRLKIKLADFGLAKLMDNAGFSGLTDDQSIRGTLAFMSPQQFRNSRSSGRSDDLFSIGACLYRFLVGQNPNVVFAAEETYSLLAAAGVPEPLYKVLRRSIDEDADNRFQSCESLLSALEF